MRPTKSLENLLLSEDMPEENEVVGGSVELVDW